MGGKDLARRGPWHIQEGLMDDRKKKYLTLPLKRKELGFDFGT